MVGTNFQLIILYTIIIIRMLRQQPFLQYSEAVCFIRLQYVAEPELKGLWREFRFDLSQEVNNVDAFMQRIDNMALEAAEMLSQGKPVS